jgi:hypothetical protein
MLVHTYIIHVSFLPAYAKSPTRNFSDEHIVQKFIIYTKIKTKDTEPKGDQW